MLVFLLVACESDVGLTGNNDVVAPTTPMASLAGRACDPSSGLVAPDAQITAMVRGADGALLNAHSTRSADDGFWALPEVEAEQSLSVRVQLNALVLEEHELTLEAGENLTLDSGPCSNPAELRIAVITGAFDDYMPVLKGLGLQDITQVDGQDESALRAFLTTPSALAEYDMLIFNGGHLEEGVIWSEDPQDAQVALVHETLRDFVVQGGDIHCSDWSYDLIEQIWPGKLSTIGSGQPDAAQLGESQDVLATVANAALSEHLNGIDELNVDYDLDLWPVLVAVSTTTSVHLVGEATYQSGGQSISVSAPMLVSFNGGGGRVVFNSYRLAANDSAEMTSLMRYVLFSL